MPLVTIALPVRNAGERIDRVARSVLGQDHPDLEFLICDNASDDDTGDRCRALAARDPRVTYHRHPENIGILPNFVSASRLASGEYFRWVSDDDVLEPTLVSRSLEVFGEDERLVLVTSQTSYTGDDGVVSTSPFTERGLRSDDPLVRFTAMLRLLNSSHLLVDPLYGLFRRDVLLSLPRRNMLREDEVMAAKLALAGPWGHVPEILAHRHWKTEKPGVLARRLGVPSWQAHCATTLECLEIYRWVDDSGNTPELTDDQRRRARAAVRATWARRERRVAGHRARKMARLATGAIRGDLGFSTGR
ncbi:glycosyltransferase family A protein [Spirillospora sp. NPDC052269]